MAYCANHPETAAVAYCRTCGKPLCERCKREVRGVIYCEECLAQRVAAADPAVTGASGVPPVPPHAAVAGRNPVLAAILGFMFPGVGAMYNGQFVKGLIQIAIFVLLIKLTDETNGLFGIAIAGWIFYMAFDAFQTAKARQLGLPAPDYLGFNRMFGLREDAPLSGAFGGPSGGNVGGSVPPPGVPAAPGEVAPVPDRGVPMGAYWLIGLGVFFLLTTTDIFNFHWNRYLWTFLVMGVGVYLFMARWTGARSRGQFCPCMRCRTRYITGPVMVFTVGFLGLLNATGLLRWHNSWPVFLIVLGAVRMVQMSASTEGHIDYAQVPPPPPPPAAPATTTEVHNG
jgi:TM2 domain-containing membrane protein YozV